MRRGVAAALTVAGIAYPFAVYAALGRVSTAWIALPLALLWLARGLTAGAAQPGSRALPAVAVVFCLVLAATDSQAGLRWYPVMVNAMMLAVFGASLKFGPPVIERLARLRPRRRVDQVGQAFRRREVELAVEERAFAELARPGLAGTQL